MKYNISVSHSGDVESAGGDPGFTVNVDEQDFDNGVIYASDTLGHLSSVLIDELSNDEDIPFGVGFSLTITRVE